MKIGILKNIFNNVLFNKSLIKNCNEKQTNANKQTYFSNALKLIWKLILYKLNAITDEKKYWSSIKYKAPVIPYRYVIGQINDKFNNELYKPNLDSLLLIVWSYNTAWEQTEFIGLIMLINIANIKRLT